MHTHAFPFSVDAEQNRYTLYVHTCICIYMHLHVLLNMNLMHSLADIHISVYVPVHRSIYLHTPRGRMAVQGKNVHSAVVPATRAEGKPYQPSHSCWTVLKVTGGTTTPAE